jgi:hypothetical protein
LCILFFLFEAANPQSGILVHEVFIAHKQEIGPSKIVKFFHDDFARSYVWTLAFW